MKQYEHQRIRQDKTWNALVFALIASVVSIVGLVATGSVLLYFLPIGGLVLGWTLTVNQKFGTLK